MQSSDRGPAPALLYIRPSIKKEKKKKEIFFSLLEILSLEEEVGKKMTWENATVLFKSRLVVVARRAALLFALLELP